MYSSQIVNAGHSTDWQLLLPRFVYAPGLVLNVCICCGENVADPFTGDILVARESPLSLNQYDSTVIVRAGCERCSHGIDGLAARFIWVFINTIGMRLANAEALDRDGYLAVRTRLRFFFETFADSAFERVIQC